MARIPAITQKESLPPHQQQIYDAIAESRGRISGPFTILLNSPEVAGRVAHLGAYIRFQSTLKPMIRELAILTTARELNCQYEWTAHVPLARQAGVREEAIASVGNRKAPEDLTSEEALIVQYGQELFRTQHVSDATFQKALAEFGVQGITELTATMGYYGMLAFALNTFEVELGPGVTPLLPL
ncbi:MAG: carboxymuconolactone decarboxylase family protein [Candidatus Tectomicrobia bacterium]|nr:carboxymuconolactone decarboxylase family protein [Candidatus Tectomicrobia bacterium]